MYVLFFSPSTRVGNTVWDRFLSLSDHFKLRDTLWLFASCVSYLASPWQAARGRSARGEVFVLDNTLCFVLPDNDGIDQRLVWLFTSWLCSKSRSCLNKSDTTVVQSLL